MRAVIQRVSRAKLEVDKEQVSAIEHGLLIYLGVTHDDTQEDIQWLVNKIVNMRIFSDAEGRMNLSVLDKKYAALVVSQFTLYASTKKGNRPSYIRSAPPDIAIPLYEAFLETMASKLPVQSGIFGADMHITYTNSGPVTITIDSKAKE